jgi:hypothetical protein
MIVTDLFESHQTCPECGGLAFSDLVLAEKKDACYSKVRSRYKVWPSAYASGALVQCRKKGAANWGNKSEGVAEAINPDITNPAFSHQQQIGDYLYVARYWSKGLKITAYDGAKKIGHAELMYQSAPFDDFADPKTTPKRIWLESEWTHVDPKYQRQGIMGTMYAYAKMLGNSVKPSQTRSDDAKAAWKSWRDAGDAQHLTREGVAEAGPVQGEYSRVLTALRLYYPRFEIEELNTPDWHRVIANKANVTPEYAGQVIDDFVKASQPDEEENLDWMDDTNDVREGVAEGLSEMDKSQTPPGRDGDIDWTKKQIHLGPEHVIKAKDVAKHALKALDKTMKKSHADTPKKKGVEEAFGPLPREKQQIRLGRHTVDIERVGLDKNYISFAWNDSKGQEHYEEVPVGDLGSYDDLIKKIKQEISYQERKYTDQGVAEGSLEELSTGLLQRAAQVAKDKRNKAMDPKIHNALGGGYMNPLAKHYDTVSQKLSNKAAKAGQQDAIEKIASPAVMRKMGMSGKGATEGVAEAGYGHRNPDLMSPGDYDRYQQDQMDHNKRDFKRREHEAEWEQEKAYSEKLAARDAGTWYIRINGKLLKDRQGQPYTFQGKAAANRAAATMMAKPFNAGKQFTLTTTAADRT